MKIAGLILLSLLLSACASTPISCELFEWGTSDFRHCRAEQGSKEYQFRLGMEYFVMGNYSHARKWLEESSKDEFPMNAREFRNGAASIDDGYSSKTRRQGKDGNEVANFMMARLYDEGLGVPHDTARAADYKQRSGGKQVAIKKTNGGFTIIIYSPSTIHPDQRLFELYSFVITRDK